MRFPLGPTLKYSTGKSRRDDRDEPQLPQSQEESAIMQARTLLFAAALLLKFGVIPGSEANTGAVLALTFIEVRIEARGHAAGVLRQPADAFIPMQEISRPERFVLLMRERSAALTEGGQEARVLTEQLKDDLTAPPDQRLNLSVSTGELNNAGRQ